MNILNNKNQMMNLMKKMLKKLMKVMEVAIFVMYLGNKQHQLKFLRV